MSETNREDTWLTRYLVMFYRGASILCILAILTRRLLLSKVIPVPDTWSGTSAVSINIAESLIETVGLFFPPVELFLWFRLVRLGYLAKPQVFDYVLLVVLYIIAIGYLPPPGSHGFFHFGR